jgi:hypothetical protein
MQIGLVTSGLLTPAGRAAWQRGLTTTARESVASIMRRRGPAIARAAQQNARAGLKGNKAWRSFRARVYADKPGRLPALRIGSRVPWLGVHETGATIAGRLLIPLIRVGPKRFRRILNELNRAGNAYWVKGRSGLPVLMAENLPEQYRVLSRFKSAERKAQRAAGGKGRLKRGQDIPIATLVPRVTLRRRLRFSDTVRRELPTLAAEISAALSRV